MANELYHHGILGMKWGVRRFQNSDGSLTTAGKKRYSKKEVEDDFQRSIDSHKDAFNRIVNNGSKIQDAANDLGAEYQKAFKNVQQLTPAEKQSIYKKIKEEYADEFNNKELLEDFDRSELFDLFAEEFVHDAVMDRVNKNETIATKREAFTKMQDDYWNDVHAISDSIMEKYRDKEIKDKYYNNGEMLVNDLLGKKLDTSFNAYISRHFDDYWVYDTDAYYDAVDRCAKSLNMSELLKKQ